MDSCGFYLKRGEKNAMKYRDYADLRRKKTPEAAETIRKSLDRVQIEVYERLYIHELAYERMIGTGEGDASPKSPPKD